MWGEGGDRNMLCVCTDGASNQKIRGGGKVTLQRNGFEKYFSFLIIFISTSITYVSEIQLYLDT